MGVDFDSGEVENGTIARASGAGAYMARIQMERSPDSLRHGCVPELVTLLRLSNAIQFTEAGTEPSPSRDFTSSAERSAIVRSTETSKRVPDQLVIPIVRAKVTACGVCA